MPQKRNKPQKRPLGYFDAQDRVIKLNTIYRTDAYGSDRARTLAGPTHRELDDASSPDPDTELEDAELSDVERNAAIARERMRREGRA
jgi:hypothetical protein